MDVVLGGPASAYSRMARAGVLAAIEPSERLPWRVVRRSPIGLATAPEPGAGAIAPPREAAGRPSTTPGTTRSRWPGRRASSAREDGPKDMRGWSRTRRTRVGSAARRARHSRPWSAARSHRPGDRGPGRQGRRDSSRPLTRPSGTLSRGERGLWSKGSRSSGEGGTAIERGAFLRFLAGRGQADPPPDEVREESRGRRLARRPAGRDARRRPGRALGCLGGARARRASRAGGATG